MSRFLLIGLDGMEPSLAARWMDEGRLPNLAALRDRGTFMPLASTKPPVTFPAWTTCVTGVNPGRHGIFDFTEMTPGDYAIRFVNSTFRKAPAVWNVLSGAGKRVCVLGVPGTYPPEPVNGVMVSGWDSPVCTGVDRSFVYPPDRFEQVKAWRFADFQESDIGPGWHVMALDRLLKGIGTKEGIATELLREEAWDFFMIVFGESDTVSHHFWLFHDKDSPRHQEGPANAIRDVYERLDAAVGRLIETAGDDVTVGVVSDHGFGGAGTGVVHLNNWLAEKGYLAQTQGGDSLLKRIALHGTPESMRGWLFRRFQRLATKAESQSRFAGIEWLRTKAWSEELNYFPSVRVNLKGREPDGQVDPSEYDAFCEELRRELETWEVVEKAWRREELFEGPYVDRAPDIILELALEDGYSHSCLRSHGTETFRRLRPEEYAGGKEKGMTGNHRPMGVLFLSKPVDAANAALQDVAPAVLAELDVAGPPMDGVSLLTPARVGVNVDAAARETAVYTPEQERQIEERLRDLGYFE